MAKEPDVSIARKMIAETQSAASEAGCFEFGFVGSPDAAGAVAHRLYGGNQRHQDQGEHDGILDCGGARFVA